MGTPEAVGPSSYDGGGGGGGDGGGRGGQQSTTASTMPTRQGSSMYNLTLNEVQNQLGEPLLSMNLDDLLRCILLPEQPNTTEVGIEEEDHHHHHLHNNKMGAAEAEAEAAGSQSGSVAAYSGVGGGGGCGGGGIIQKQGSVTPLSRALSKKTVDEVWKDIQKGQQQQQKQKQKQKQQQQQQRGPDASGVAERQATLGEMTLEDFLVKAGVMVEGSWDSSRDRFGREGNSGGSNAVREGGMLPPPAHCHCHWLQQQQQQQLPLRPVVVGGSYGLAPHHHHHHHHRPMPLPLKAVVDVGYSDQMRSIPSPTRGTLPGSPAATGRKRAASANHGTGDVAERTVERRQKRMIKNRESAARSRARKQAYTNELENKVSRLEEENEWLKKQQELDRILYATPIPEPKFRLRRTSSATL